MNARHDEEKNEMKMKNRKKQFTWLRKLLWCAYVNPLITSIDLFTSLKRIRALDVQCITENSRLNPTNC